MARVRFKNGRKFRLDLRKFAELTEEQHAALLKKIAFQLLGLIVSKTPVDTGRAQNNWQVAVDAAAGTAQVSGGGNVFSGALSALAKVKAFSTIILYNNVEYIVFLEHGTSKQAPRGMVSVSIQEVESQFR